MRPGCAFLSLAMCALSQGSLCAQDLPVAGTTAQEAGLNPSGRDVLTWEELPEDFRRRAEGNVDRIHPQAVLFVEQDVEADATFRNIDHGDLVFVQWVRPAGVARIVQPVRNSSKYGPRGAVLWPGVGPQGTYWCWRRDDPATLMVDGNIYCYLDTDGDGVSERLMENDIWAEQLRRSHFQFVDLGHNEGVRESASFVIEPDAVGEMREVVALRYYGATRGLVGPDQKFGPGLIEFELMVGPSPRALEAVRRIVVRVDEAGRADFIDFNGVHFLIDGVHLDGTARIRLLSALPAGRGLLRPTVTREMVLDYANRSLHSDGQQRPDAAPLDWP